MITKKTQSKKANNVATQLWRWTKETIKLVLILSLFSIAIDFWRSKDMPSETIPTLATNTIDQQWVDIEKMSYDKPVLLYFWATWCSVCNLVSPSINWLADDHQVISIAITSGDDRRLSQFMKYKKYDFPVINDPTGKISREWGVTATPSIVIVKEGHISSITTGATTPMGLWLRLFFA
ncbi:hypothetical protein CTM93_12250 [Photobacterium phosphoreum]|uniref:protein disulfide oxidoreductase n=1 Tax=Photobacterium phosphoreum TaxID=659 RepID=UPI000D17F5E5|nr:protein disulfide oxidoreductase [Photobacterium phosphoreum]PSU82854.1 hypothetical protein CTM93_12250 [Photobacterium phosphoreum]